MVQTKSHSVYDEVFELSPKALQDVCLSTVSSNLHELTSFEVAGDGFEKSTHFSQNISVSNKVAEKLMEEFSVQNCLQNDTLSIFKDSTAYSLRTLKLPEIHMDLCGTELLNYSNYPLRELELGCTHRQNRWSIKKLKQSFAGSRRSLTYLKINIYPAVSITSGTIFDFFTQFPNLKKLFYNSPIHNNSISFTNKNWNSLVTSCPLLKVLNVNVNGSSKDTELDSEIFCHRASNLHSLSLYCALKSELAIESFSCVEHFLYMEQLRELDLSVDVDPRDIRNIQVQVEDRNSHTDLLATHMNLFLQASQYNLPCIESLDISGIHDLDDSNIQVFLDSHPSLTFLGLCMLHSQFSVNADAAEYYENVKISGCFLESQIINSLLKYTYRMTYMKETLKGLFQISSSWDRRRPYILKIVLEIMERFKGHLSLQMAATACVFHLAKDTTDGLKPDVHVVLLSEIARVTSMILVLYVGNLQMVKNCLLILCTDRILHNAKFDRVAMTRLCLNCMLSYQEDRDRHVTRMAVAIVSILACKISSKDTSNLMQEKEMKLLLDIVEKRLTQRMVDGILKFDLSALWNLTDESPQACKLFVDLDGLNKYIRILEVFANDMQIETKALGLLNNIAEVEFLHDVMLLDEELLKRVRILISNSQVQVSYFACGIIANLALRWNNVRTALLITEKEEILNELSDAIQRWGKLEGEIVTYRSFKPFYGLLKCHDKPQIQRWAVWAIHHVCSLSAGHYRGLMNDECIQLIENTRLNTPCNEVSKLCGLIYEAIGKHPIGLK